MTPLALLRTLRAVFRPALAALDDALRIENTADDVIADTWQILDAAATDHHYRVFLQVMAFARNIAHDFEAVGEPHLGDFPQRRVRLLRRCGINARANAALLRARLHGRNLVAITRNAAWLTNELVDCRHRA